MKEFKGTKGQWHLESQTNILRETEFFITDDFDVCVAGTGSTATDEYLDYNTQKANAKLIAAAPDLLNALQDFVEAMEDAASPMEFENIYRAAIEAIDKAL